MSDLLKTDRDDLRWIAFLMFVGMFFMGGSVTLFFQQPTVIGGICASLNGVCMLYYVRRVLKGI